MQHQRRLRSLGGLALALALLSAGCDGTASTRSPSRPAVTDPATASAATSAQETTAGCCAHLRSAERDLRSAHQGRVSAYAPTRAAARDLVERLAVSRADVRRVVRSGEGRLTAYLPKDERRFQAMLPRGRRGYDTVAAVTLPNSLPGPAAVIVLNPRVWHQLSPQGARVVLTHEATHVATGSALVDMPAWVSEGFADYVAIAAVHAHVRVAGREALTSVRRHGAPTRLPSEKDFWPGRGDAKAEVSYEQAWIAMRLLGSTYGQARLVRFHAAVVRHPHTVATVMRSRLGTSLSAFTVVWRDRLIQWAHAH